MESFFFKNQFYEQFYLVEIWGTLLLVGKSWNQSYWNWFCHLLRILRSWRGPTRAVLRSKAWEPRPGENAETQTSAPHVRDATMNCGVAITPDSLFARLLGPTNWQLTRPATCSTRWAQPVDFFFQRAPAVKGIMGRKPAALASY